MHNCNFCSAIDWQGGYFHLVSFATPLEESNLRGYKGGYVCYRYVCPNCALRINSIINQFPQELKAKR